MQENGNIKASEEDIGNVLLVVLCRSDLGYYIPNSSPIRGPNKLIGRLIKSKYGENILDQSNLMGDIIVLRIRCSDDSTGLSSYVLDSMHLKCSMSFKGLK